MAKHGRRTEAQSRVDTKPGQVMLLGVLANVPIGFAFILGPLLTRDDPRAGASLFLPFVSFVTPFCAALGIAIFARAGDRRRHRAARIGIALCATAILLWLLVMFAPHR